MHWPSRPPMSSQPRLVARLTSRASSALASSVAVWFGAGGGARTGMEQRYRDGGTFMTSYVSEICGLPSSASSSYVPPLEDVPPAAVDSRVWLVRSVWEDCAS